jgi:flavin-dependent dehydrogenase
LSSLTCEIAVIGGGLAGCCAAISLARAGRDVALFESGPLPRHRVCGEFLSPESRVTLQRLGVMAEIEAAGARPVGHASFSCGGQSADFALGSAAGIALSRFALDPLLWNAAASAGARTFLETKIRHLESDGEGFAFRAGDRKWHAHAVILATGRGGAPKAGTKARFCGIKAHFAGAKLETGVVEMHLFKGGYCGMVRVEGEATNACLLVDYAQLPKGSPAAFWELLLSQNAGLRERLGDATRLTDWQTTANVGFETFRPVGEGEAEKSGVPRGVLCAGDAAGYIHPLTGDGMAMALRAGELAGTVARLQLDNAEAARLYRAAWEREFAPRLALAARIHPLAVRPQWAKPLLPALRYFPVVRSAMVRGTRGRNG